MMVLSFFFYIYFVFVVTSIILYIYVHMVINVKQHGLYNQWILIYVVFDNIVYHRSVRLHIYIYKPRVYMYTQSMLYAHRQHISQ